MKIAVYAIALNEAKHARRFVRSAEHADIILIADTGSTDMTARIAQDEHEDGIDGQFIAVNIGIKPFRFDHARNAALALVPADVDVCIALDMDEVLLPGWRHHVEAHMDHGATRMTYGFDLDKGRRMVGHRIHARHAYDWKYPIHEALIAKRGVVEKVTHCNTDLISHRPDDSKPRRYLPMLIDAVKDYPDDARMAFYLGRELMFSCQWDNAASMLHRYLALDTTWREQRAEAMRYIGRCNERMDNPMTATMHYLSATMEAPRDRTAWLELADNFRRSEDWAAGLWAVQHAFNCEETPTAGTYDPYLLTVGIYDIGSLCAYYSGDKALAAQWFRKAVELDPGNARLQKNLSFVTPP